ncbi:MAG: tryptophan synthase subunit alpha [Aureispira sp.]|nr:tryptophan synthase subunit alpha [Aureispira sp.]
MNRLDQLFNSKKENILNIYCTAGYPNLEDTTSIIKALENSGVDLVELGMPYSDPLADGPTIQASGTEALANGMSIVTLFEQLKDVRKEVKLPLVLMGYLNPVLQYGVEAFLKQCQQVGVDGLILPDLPLYEYEEAYQELFEQYNIHPIFLVTPLTPVERIHKIDSLSKGFVYAVSTASTTGKQSGFGQEQLTYFQRLKDLKLNNPILVGFGVADHQTYSTVCDYVNGAVVGSAFIRALKGSGNLEKTVEDFVTMLKATTLLEHR